MKTITIVGWSAKAQERSVVERVSYWPDEMELNIAIAKAGQATDLMTIEGILVEEQEVSEKEPIKVKVILGHETEDDYQCKYCGAFIPNWSEQVCVERTISSEEDPSEIFP